MPKKYFDLATKELKGYVYGCNYDLYYEGSSNKKDFSLGKIFTIKNISGSFIVDGFGITSPDGNVEE